MVYENWKVKAKFTLRKVPLSSMARNGLTLVAFVHPKAVQEFQRGALDLCLVLVSRVSSSGSGRLARQQNINPCWHTSRLMCVLNIV